MFSFPFTHTEREKNEKKKKKTKKKGKILHVPGAIIGDGDRKRAPFLVLGLAP